MKADDPEQTLYEFIPPSYSKLLPEFTKVVEKDAIEFRPIGDKIGAYRIKADRAAKDKGKGKAKAKDASAGATLPERSWEIVAEGEGEEDDVLYEAYAANWDTPGFKEYHRRMQVFVLLFIEGATYIEEEDSRWEFLTLYVVFAFIARVCSDLGGLELILCGLVARRSYERRKSGSTYSYHFVGFTSFYSFFCWPDTKRLRLS